MSMVKLERAKVKIERSFKNANMSLEERKIIYRDKFAT